MFIQICNHNYLLADGYHRLQDYRPLLKDYRALIVDEAHKLPDAAKQMFGKSLCYDDIREICFYLGKEYQGPEIRKLSGTIRMVLDVIEDELKEYASLVKYYWEKDKSKEKVVIAWDDLAEIQQNAKILKNYLSKISIETLNTLLCFYEIGNSNLTVEKLENTYKYIVDSEFDEMYIIRKLKQKNACLRIIVGMKKCGQVTYEKQMQAALKEEKVEL